jgi:hypothetical protein
MLNSRYDMQEMRRKEEDGVLAIVGTGSRQIANVIKDRMEASATRKHKINERKTISKVCF